MKVLKFGGSSVKDANNIKKVIAILKSQYEKKTSYTVVVSAFGGVTDLLIEMSQLASKGKEDYKALLDVFGQRTIKIINDLLTGDRKKAVSKSIEENQTVLENLLHGIFLVREASPRTMDYVLSFGERTSAYVISHACEEQGIKAEYLDARKIIKTNKNFGKAKVSIGLTYQKTKEHYQNKDKLQIVTGFISSDVGGLTTTLGRGGSDYTASLLSAALDAELLDIWTDVDGILTSDPRKVKKAFTVKQLSYNEAMELSHFGAKVIYPPTILPALDKGIPIYIKNTFNPEFEGTKISDKEANKDTSQVTGISALKNVALLRLQGGGMVGIPGISSRLFGALAREHINVILITQSSSEYSISFSIESSNIGLAKRAIKEEFEKEFSSGSIQEISVEEDLSILAIVSEKMRNQPGVAGKLFCSLGKEGINVIAIAQGSSELNISFVISSHDEKKALNLIHDAFFLSKATTINIFSAGAGLIGKTLFKQIHKAHQSVYSNKKLDLKLIGLANSKKMVFNAEGIALAEWSDELSNSESNSDIDGFIKQMIDLNLPNSVFIDNTANKDLPKQYLKILENNVSIVTPNKVASSSSFDYYQQLKEKAKSKNVHFLYETNVGAGLPIISTISQMTSSGDRIIKLEAVLSGSISYIFNTYDGSLPFSEVVLQAKEKGYTEPDPRDDLSGLDVIRKITILARETGLNIETKDVSISPILNEACLNAASIENFFVELKKMDAYFEEKYKTAESKGKKLRFIAKMEDNKCSVGIESVSSASSFYNLAGSDNMVVIFSQRYHERPLVVKGPGAGADVTAAGVFSEILQIGSQISKL